MNYTYNTIGTCSARIDFEVRETPLPDGTTRRTLHNVIFYGGCNGNLQGISRLVEGMEIDAVLEKLEGISCNGGPTSCPDQLCQALRKIQ